MLKTAARTITARGEASERTRPSVWVYWLATRAMCVCVFLNSHRGTTAQQSGTEVAVRQDCTRSPSKMSGCCFRLAVILV